MPYSKIQWVNDTQPALNQDNLNRMEDGIEGSSKAVDRLSDAKLDTINNAKGLGAILDKLINNISSGTSTTDDIVVNGKIDLAKLEAMLSQMQFNSSTNEVSIGGSAICTTGEYGAYVFNASSTDFPTNIDDGTDYFLLHFDMPGTESLTSCSLDLGTTTITIGDDSTADINFFDNDTFEFFDVEFKRVKSDAGLGLMTVSGYNAKGYNRRTMSAIVSVGLVDEIDYTISGTHDATLLYATPGSSTISAEQTIPNFAPTPFDAEV